MVHLAKVLLAFSFGVIIFTVGTFVHLTGQQSKPIRPIKFLNNTYVQNKNTTQAKQLQVEDSIEKDTQITDDITDTQINEDVVPFSPQEPTYFFPLDDPRHQAYPYTCHANRISEAIDVVYLWVNGTDPWYQEQLAIWLNRTTLNLGVKNDVAGKQRFRDNGELRYSLRSVAEFLQGWIRYIHIVVNGDQVPAWLDRTHEGIFIVPHRVIFEFPSEHLPTFNTFAIKANLHRIPNLADRFIIVDDDMLFLSANATTLYVNSAGGQYLFLQPKPLIQNQSLSTPARLNVANSEWRAIEFTNRMFHSRFGSSNRYYPNHLPSLVDRSLLAYLTDQFRQEFNSTSAHRFRAEDIHLQFLYNNFADFVKAHKYHIPFELEATFRQQLDWNHDGALNDCEMEILKDRVLSLDKVCLAVHRTLPESGLLDTKRLLHELNTLSQTPQRTTAAIAGFEGIVEALRVRHDCLHTRWNAAERKEPSGGRFLMLKTARGLEKEFDALKRNAFTLVCINDDLPEGNVYNDAIALLHRWFNNQFPVPASWELREESVQPSSHT